MSFCCCRLVLGSTVQEGRTARNTRRVSTYSHVTSELIIIAHPMIHLSVNNVFPDYSMLHERTHTHMNLLDSFLYSNKPVGSVILLGKCTG